MINPSAYVMAEKVASVFEQQTQNKISKITTVARFAKPTMVLNNKLKMIKGSKNTINDFMLRLMAYKTCLASKEINGLS